MRTSTLPCILVLLGSLWGAQTATSATPLFESTLCQSFGCAVVYNGEDWELYLLAVAPGQGARLWASSSGQRQMGTAERAQNPTGLPGDDEGSALGVDLDGDAVADLLIEPGAGGFLDASAALPAFPLTASSELTLAKGELRHSFWIAANVPVAVHGQARWTRNSGRLGADFEADEVTLSVEVGERDAAVAADIEPGLRHLADLVGAARHLLTLPRGTAEEGAGEVHRQLVQVAVVYRFSGYDLSHGTGELGAEVEYSLFRP